MHKIILCWETGTEATPLLLRDRHRGHASFPVRQAQRPCLLSWEAGTEAPPPFRRDRDGGHASVAERHLPYRLLMRVQVCVYVCILKSVCEWQCQSTEDVSDLLIWWWNVSSLTRRKVSHFHSSPRPLCFHCADVSWTELQSRYNTIKPTSPFRIDSP